MALWASGMRLTPARLNRPWTSYSVSWTASTTNPTVGDGTLIGKYRYLDSDTVQVKILLIPGSMTTYGSGGYRFSLPVPASGPDLYLPSAALLGSSLYSLVGWGNTSSPTSTLFMYRGNVTSTENLASWTATTPVTFAAGHRVSVLGEYAIA